MNIASRFILRFGVKGIVIIAAGIAVVVFVMFFAIGRISTGTQETIAVVRGTITETVAVTGRTKPAEDVELAFEESGRVVEAPTKIGDRVAPGALLIRLDTTELAADLAAAAAATAAERAVLAEYQRGTRPEELAIKETKLANAIAALADARRNAVENLRDAYTKADDAVRNKADQSLSNPRSLSPQINFTVSDPALERAVETGRPAIEAILNDWGAKTSALTISADLAKAATDAQGNLDAVRSYLGSAAAALNAITTSSAISQTTIDGWRGDAATARTNVNTATANLSTASSKLTTAIADEAIARRELDLSRAGKTREEIASQEAKVAQSEAKESSIRARIARRAIRAPVAGIVTKQEATPGEIVTAGATVVAIIGEGRFKIEANVPEIDIGRITLDNPVEITLDAFSGERFTGRIVAIDPAETVVDGVVNFRITVAFGADDARLKSGLTANLAIETRRHDNVLTLPQFALIESDRGTFIKKIVNGNVEERAVEIGLRGRDGMVEIISGAEEGERVVNVGKKTAE